MVGNFGSRVSGLGSRSKNASYSVINLMQNLTLQIERECSIDLTLRHRLKLILAQGNRSFECSQHFANLVAFVEQRIVLREEAYISAQEDVGFKLIQAPDRVAQKLCVFSTSPSPVSFRYVGWNRYRGASHLRHQAIAFFRRELLGSQINALDQLAGHLPGSQLSIAFQRLRHMMSLGRCCVLNRFARDFERARLDPQSPSTLASLSIRPESRAPIPETLSRMSQPKL